jgi:osmotically-inducible protein OsmY
MRMVQPIENSLMADQQIRQTVEKELRWRSGIDATDIGVSVKDAVVTLSGYSRNYSDRAQAEEVAKGVAGVCAVANDIEVRLANSSRPSDPQIARAVMDALKAALPHAHRRLHAVVRDRTVTIEGAVRWAHECTQVDRIIRRVPGVRGMINRIQIDIDDESVGSGIRHRV